MVKLNLSKLLADRGMTQSELGKIKLNHLKHLRYFRYSTNNSIRYLCSKKNIRSL